jgi:hypothetical protein
VAQAANMKESYESTKLLLGKIKYDEFKWKLCGDLKVLALLLGMQLGTQNISVSCVGHLGQEESRCKESILNKHH